jgi:hypothetical protein
MSEITANIPEDYQLSNGEIDNIVYLICKYTVGWDMRQADRMACQMMMCKGKSGLASLQDLVHVTCEYVWDHICGEPINPTPEQLYEHMVPMISSWFENTTSQEERSKTS